MSKFAHLQKLQVNDVTAYVHLPEVCPGAKLEVKIAGEANPLYWNALLKKTGRRARELGRNKISPEAIEQNRLEDRRLYPKFVIVGWEGILDANDRPVEFSMEECYDFIAQLPNWLFDRVRDQAADPNTFIADEDDELPDAEELSGNSETDSSGS